MISNYIGSGDTASLLAGVKTKSFAKLLQRFVSDEKPDYNAKASPINALRTGAILEERYILILSDDYYPQVRARCEEMDVLRCSLDFAKLSGSDVVDFDELKSLTFNDFLELENYRDDNDDGVKFIKKKYKKYYNQVQQQLLCTGLDSATVTFLAVYTYDDEVNYQREIQDNEYIRFRISRDEDVIKKIKDRALIFQQIKDYLNGSSK